MALHNFVPAARNRRIKQTKRDECATNHNRGLDQIGPDDGLDAAERGVNRRENDDDNRGTDVNPERLSLVWSSAADHFVGERERDGRDIQSRPGREQARDHEDSGRRILTRDAEARGQVFVNRVNFVVVVRFDENVADQNASDDRAKGEL